MSSLDPIDNYFSQPPLPKNQNPEQPELEKINMYLCQEAFHRSVFFLRLKKD